MGSVTPINASYWQSQRVFITGHTGFIGSWLTKTLDMLGVTVFGYSLHTDNESSLFNELDFSNNFQQTQGNICNYSQLVESMSKFAPTLIIHLAAESLVRRAYTNPSDTFNTNINGSINVFEAIKEQSSTPNLISFTTDKVYKNSESGIGFLEEDSLGGLGVYDTSKACVELISQAYHHNFLKLYGIATIRAGNVIGGGDWNLDRLIPDFIRAWQQKSGLDIRMPNAVRPWQHVMDPVLATLSLAEKLSEDPVKFSGGWNIGPDIDSHITVKKLIELLGIHLDYAPGIHCSNSAIHESQKLYLNTSKAKNNLHWSPATNLERSIDLTVSWYKASAKKNDMNHYTESQINSLLVAEN